jgi:hypothetical protein
MDVCAHDDDDDDDDDEATEAGIRQEKSELELPLQFIQFAKRKLCLTLEAVMHGSFTTFCGRSKHSNVEMQKCTFLVHDYKNCTAAVKPVTVTDMGEL